MEKFTKEPWVARLEEANDGTLDYATKSFAKEASLHLMPETGDAEHEPAPAEDNGKHMEWWIETLDGRKIAVLHTGDDDADEANARLASTSVEMYCTLKKLLESGAIPENERKRVESVLVRARGEENENTMTSEQIEACTEYLNLIEDLKRWSNDSLTWEPVRGRRSDFTTGSFERARQDAHFKLLEAYGFEYEYETADVTGNIPDGMTVRELHDALMLLKERKKMETVAE